MNLLDELIIFAVPFDQRAIDDAVKEIEKLCQEIREKAKSGDTTNISPSTN